MTMTVATTLVRATSSPCVASKPRQLLQEMATYWAVQGLRYLAMWLPERLLRTVAIGVGDFAFFVIRWRRRVALANVARACPRLSQTQQFQLAREAYTHLAFALLWTLRFPPLIVRHGADVIVDRVVDVDTPTRAQLAHLIPITDDDKNLSQSAIVTTGHIGVWELLPATLASSLLPRHTQWIVYRPLHNASVDTLVEEIRAGENRHLVADKHCFHILADALTNHTPQPSIVGLVADQRSTNPYTRCAVRFLGQETHISTGAARLHITTRSPVWFAAIVVNEKCFRSPATEKPFKLLLRPISMSSMETASDVKRVQGLTQVYADILQETVLAYASQYLWMHDLWSIRAQTLVSDGKFNER